MGESGRVLNMQYDEQMLFKDMKIMYQTGKGNHLVPFLVPLDTIPALEKLSDAQTRLDCGIIPVTNICFQQFAQTSMFLDSMP